MGVHYYQIRGNLVSGDNVAVRYFGQHPDLTTTLQGSSCLVGYAFTQQIVGELNTPPETVPLDRTNGAPRPLKWCMVTAAMVH